MVPRRPLIRAIVESADIRGILVAYSSVHPNTWGRSSMEFGMLGPVTVTVAGRDVPLGGARSRAVLAGLLLGAGRVVSVDELAELAWDAPPAHRPATTAHRRAPAPPALAQHHPADRVDRLSDGFHRALAGRRPVSPPGSAGPGSRWPAEPWRRGSRRSGPRSGCGADPHWPGWTALRSGPARLGSTSGGWPRSSSALKPSCGWAGIGGSSRSCADGPRSTRCTSRSQPC